MVHFSAPKLLGNCLIVSSQIAIASLFLKRSLMFSADDEFALFLKLFAISKAYKALAS